MKVLVLNSRLFHYRIEFWNKLATYCDLTVAYSLGDDSSSNYVQCNFPIIYLPAYSIGKRFIIQKDNISRLARNFDVIVVYGDIAWLKYSTLPWFTRKKIVIHTLGVSASYSKGYDKNKKWDRVRSFFYNQANAIVFYTEYPIDKYTRLGIAREKMFVAPNTIYVKHSKHNLQRNNIIMIGSLYKEKGIMHLINAYKDLKRTLDIPKLYIIGEGEEHDSIQKAINDNFLNDLITLTGGIYKIDKKAEYFANAVACISPKQAGLSVLESMGYGVPFITTKDALTGGEIFNIKNGVNGVILENISNIKEVIIDITKNKNKYIQMGVEAKKYYDTNTTIEHMAKGLWEAIEYAYDN